LALVPQQTRGEVAAVDLSADPPRILDSDRRVPGFTFVEAGEVPIAIAVSETNPTCTWVANRGSRDIAAIETVRFIDEGLAVLPRRAPLSLQTVDAEGDAAMGGWPESMVLVERGGRSELWVALPEDAAIARIAVDPSECRFEGIDILPLRLAAIPDPPSGPPPPLAESSPATLAVCPDTAIGLVSPSAPEATIEPSPPADELGPPAPVRIVVERDDSGAPVALLIADAAWPVIHRYELTTDTFDVPYRTDGPVRDLALTPPVPDSLDPGSPSRRYVYAIDAGDGTVMVLDHASRHVLPVQSATAARPDRLPFPAPARALEVIATRDPGGICRRDDAPPAPDVLRGVFVAVALSDATVRIVDVLDGDAVCRSGPGCTDRFVGTEQLSFVRRHRPRIGTRMTNGVAVSQAPSIAIERALLRYSDNGRVEEEPAAPVWAEIECPPGLGPIFAAGDGRRGRICGVTDPWSAEPEQWRIVWQGAIPGTGSTGGNIRDLGDGTVAIDSRIDACARGVLGPSPEYAGDLLAITGELPADTATDPICRALIGLDASGHRRPVLIPIRDVIVGGAVPLPARSRLVVNADEPVLGRVPVAVGDEMITLTMRHVVECFAGELVTFDVRVRGAFAVIGSRTGFLHRVIADPEGHCVVDSTQPAEREGRAWLGSTFSSRQLAFRLDPGPGSNATDFFEVDIRFEVGGVPTQLAIPFGASGSGAPGSLPRELVWNAIDQQLYGIDETRRGLVVMGIAPFQLLRTIE
jgi:hypothetical protein